jgi:choline-sulfatase
MPARRPNILLVQTDQLTAFALAAYGNPVCRTPHIDRLAEGGAVFEQAYCNFPLCAPSRFSMMTGQLASRIGAFDNAAELPASVPTFAHYLRGLGYRTCLSGKMHFVGPDQLHGFEERLTSDIYPADFLWTADWTRSDHDDVSDARVVTRSGLCTRSVQLDYDDQVAARAVRWLGERAGERNAPFLLTVSFTHPHDPFVCTQPYWDLYEGAEIDPPRVSPQAALDPHSRRLLTQYGLLGQTFSEEQVLAARRGYYGAISYIDARLGDLLRTLEEAGLAGETVVVFTSDHGEMLGERGMWLKKCFFEPACRIPLIVSAPFLFAGRRVAEPVSLVDLLPTLLGLAGDGAAPEPIEPLDGLDLTGALAGGGLPERPLLGEILGEGTPAPVLMVRRGRHKYVSCPLDPPQLYDLEADPDEVDNLAGRAEAAEVEAAFAAETAATWDIEALDAAIRLSQRRRLLIQRAHGTGRPPVWDHLPGGEADEGWFRGQSSYGDWAFDYE